MKKKKNRNPGKIAMVVGLGTRQDTVRSHYWLPLDDVGDGGEL